jgi:excisionase family DNA binding protein
MVKGFDGEGTTSSTQKSLQQYQGRGCPWVLTCMKAIEELRSRPGYIGVREAAEYIDINRYTLIDWINARTIRGSKIGNAFKIDRSYLADWLEARELTTA